MSQLTVLAIDLGAESGRVMAVHFDGRKLSVEALHRFPNPLTVINGTIHWDFLHLWREIIAGIEKGKRLRPQSIGVDTWGVDFALLDKSGALIGNPVNYRDPRTEGMMEVVFAKVPRPEVFEQTGIQFLPINTLYQLVSLVQSDSPQLAIANTFLTVPDLLNYWLTGEKACEFTNATTTQLFNPRAGSWANGLMKALDIPTHIFPEVIPPGTPLGRYEGIPVIAPATHDTGSAVAAVPATTSQFAYISSGTWSLVGMEIEAPLINAAALAANVTNEGGVNQTYRLLKNVMGLWILQQCRATWEAQGETHGYPELVNMAYTAARLRSFVNPDDGRFLAPGDHPSIIREFCEDTGQPAPSSKGEFVRCVLESLALRYRQVLDTLTALTGKRVETLHVVGGGSRNELLNQLTADATGIPVVAGPVEATVLGNALLQLISLGEIARLDEGRQLVGESAELETYVPEDGDIWQSAYERFEKLCD